MLQVVGACGFLCSQKCVGAEWHKMIHGVCYRLCNACEGLISKEEMES